MTGPAVSYLVRAIRQIKEESPGADITVDVMPSRDLLMQLGAGEMDFVLGRILPEFDSDSFNILPMSDEKVALMARADHPLARARLVTLTELVGQEWIMQQRGSPIREATLAAFASVGLSEPDNIGCDHARLARGRGTADPAAGQGRVHDHTDAPADPGIALFPAGFEAPSLVAPGQAVARCGGADVAQPDQERGRAVTCLRRAISQATAPMIVTAMMISARALTAGVRPVRTLDAI